ncbi:MAG TPA: sugar transferase [Bacteroidales bacterium]|nr:sugar transferase [Bacteroidales bacterium]
MVKKSLAFIITDIFLVALVFGILIWIKPGTFRYYIPTYKEPFILFLSFWFTVSIFSRKYEIFIKRKLRDMVRPVLLANFIILSVIAIGFYGFAYYSYSRLIVFGTILFSTLLELFILYIYYNNLHRSRDTAYYEQEKVPQAEAFGQQKAEGTPESLLRDESPLVELSEQHRELIISEAGKEAFDFLANHFRAGFQPALVLSTTAKFNVDNQPDNFFRSIINLEKINDIKRVNKFFESVNGKLPMGGYFIDCVETNEIKKSRILKKYPVLLNYFIYFWYYIFRRLIPKLPLLKQIYFLITNGWDRSLSKAETFGRLYCCGFELADSRQIGGLLYFVARKVKLPCFDPNPTYGLLIRLKRIGKKGKPITVYKFRTMHPYAEYIQDYVFRQNDLREGGKFRNDFRVTTTGRILRKFWLDELPMLFSWIKGDIKLFGVRPLSRHYFELYSEEVKEKRIRVKPGLVPPFYADMPKTLDEIMASEMDYLDQYFRHPLTTDLSYFFKALYNIIFKRARSN